MELTSLDYEILEFINRFDTPVHKDKITNRFSQEVESLDYRLELLATPEFTTGRLYMPIKNTNYIDEVFDNIRDTEANVQFVSKNTFYITDKGKIALQNYMVKKRAELRHKYEELAWRAIPIVISLFALAKSYQWL